MMKLFLWICFVCTGLTLNGQASGGWGNCEFATLTDLNGFDPSTSPTTCKKAYVQSINEHYHWIGSAWVKESEDVVNIYSTDNFLSGDRVVDLNSYNLSFINGGTFLLDSNLELGGGTIRLSDFGSGSRTGSEVYFLGVENDGNLIEIPLSAASENLYNSDGTLTGNRTLVGSSFNLYFNGLNAFSTSAITSTIGSNTNSIYQADNNFNGTGEHRFMTGSTQQMTLENTGTLNLSQYGSGFQEDNQNNTYDLALDGSGNVIEVDRRVKKIYSTSITLTTDQNDLSLTGLTTAPYYEIYRINPTSDVDLTGVEAINVKNGQLLTLMNISTSKKFKVISDGVDSSPSNRIIMPNDSDKDIRKGESVTLIYDSFSNRWRTYSLARG